MDDNLSAERLTENEVIFRNENERARRTLQTIFTSTEPIFFVCECADANCRERIGLTSREFSELHRSKQRFVIKPGHQVLRIEKVVKETPDYIIVEKYLPTSPALNND